MENIEIVEDFYESIFYDYGLLEICLKFWWFMLFMWIKFDYFWWWKRIFNLGVLLWNSFYINFNVVF